MSDWTWEYISHDLGESLPAPVRAEVERIAAELAVVNSMVYLEGAAYQGLSPGLRVEYGNATDGAHVMLSFLTDVRGERIVIVSVQSL
ncbi:hypothetical protein SSOG_02745 [Streptomyces himastatinicus ATCC 53653]|uniref:Uncharacterized protein n=1 Tax=Streptomyces himastatinicus ATCC 53653 TaxID=457427 RepID=D9WCV2_9ACTN|nr:hypothetical protein [Streptomyces himastatinicus]EFL23031.1 hypothetical protein SSOG_02745 [Streptomyces himastatinicus ATCC 53653]